MRFGDRQHFLIDNAKYVFVAVCQISHPSQEVAYENKMLSTTSGLVCLQSLINTDFKKV